MGAVLPEGFLFDPDQNKAKGNGNEAKYDPTGILARSHSLPVALTWLLLQLGCPVVRMLTSTFPDKSVTSNGTCKTINPVGQRHSAVYLARARNALHLSDDASADGLLAGADKLSEKSLQDAERLFLSDGAEGGAGILYDPTAGTTPSWPVLQPSQPLPPLPSQQFPSRPLLPPGVMAATPPAGLTSDQLSVPTPKGLDDTFPSPALSSSKSNSSFLKTLSACFFCYISCRFSTYRQPKLPTDTDDSRSYDHISHTSFWPANEATHILLRCLHSFKYWIQAPNPRLM